MPTVTSSDGTRIVFDQYGSGQFPVVLVSGALQYRVFDPPTVQLAKLLAERFTVFHYDRRGRGDSSDEQPYAPDREVEDLAAVVAATGGSACLFGMSSGAVLALNAAAAGVAGTRLALYEPPLIIDGSRPAMPDDYLARLSALLAEGRRGDAVELFMTTSAGVPPEVVAQMRQAPMWAGFEAVAPTLRYDVTMLNALTTGQPLPPGIWGGVDAPTLVIVGGASQTWVHNTALAIAGVLPEAHTTVLDEQDHAVDPTVLAPVLVDFFTS